MHVFLSQKLYKKILVTLILLITFHTKFLPGKLEQLQKSLINVQTSLINLRTALLTEKSDKVDPVQLNLLLEDMKNYKLEEIKHGKVERVKDFHAGDLYEHSMWVEQVIADWCRTESKEPWCSGLSERDKYITALAGLLHDVGKGGDLKFSYYVKSGHPAEGFEYLIGKKPYHMKDFTDFDFKKLLKNLTDNERKVISILEGIHWSFGGEVIANFKAGGDNNQMYKKFLNHIKGLAGMIGYKKEIDETLVKQCILIGAADVKGSQPATGHYTLVFSKFTQCYPFCSVADRFTMYHYDTLGPVARQGVLDYFNNTWYKEYKEKKNKAGKE